MMGMLVADRAREPKSIATFDGDLDEASYAHALQVDVIAWDSETTGLDWKTERIATVQVQIGQRTHVVRLAPERPCRLIALMERHDIRKILHHAMFDLRFLANEWGVKSSNVACTKIASKLVNPDIPCNEHSLVSLLRRYLRVDIDKSLQTSDWTTDLSSSQLEYAANDVRYLVQLYNCLDARVREQGLLDLRERCYAHLPTQVELEVGGFPDVFAY